MHVLALDEGTTLYPKKWCRCLIFTYLKCSVMYLRSCAFNEKASVISVVIRVAEESGSLCSDLPKHQVMSSSPKKSPGPSAKSLVWLLRRRYWLFAVPRTMKNI